MSSRILVTGGSGFLGRNLGTLLRASHEPVLGSRNHQANARAREISGCETVPLDVSNIDSVRDVVSAVRPQIIIHAAATKYVGLAESHPLECVDINVRGSQNVARAAVESDVEVVIGVSTDKAASPIGGTYALSKALMERVYCAMDGTSDTSFACVRFGNIAWSTGSVFPEWKAMTEKDGHVTSTGPDMTRFFMSVTDAAEVVLSAMRNIDELRGSVLIRPMQAAAIREILDVWTRLFDCTWAPGERRIGDQDHEWLIGPADASRTRTATVDGEPAFIISPTAAGSPPSEVVELTSATAPRLSAVEIESLIQAPQDC